VVIVLSDANLATGVSPFPRPELDARWQSVPPDLSAVPEGTLPFDWDPELGLSRRVIPGQPGGMYTLTSLSHNERGKVAYDPEAHERGCAMRSRKIAVLQETLKRPSVHGDPTGDLLVVGWGSTRGAIEEAVDRAREEGLRVSSLHLTFLYPLAPGLKEIFAGFRKVMTVEINYSDKRGDPHITDENRRLGQLCWMLRANTLVDVDCWTRVPGQPLRPAKILDAIQTMVPKGDA
jgi:2-oxoglutarate ferredoxin oxidoreductase subunit alpha